MSAVIKQYIQKWYIICKLYEFLYNMLYGIVRLHWLALIIFPIIKGNGERVLCSLWCAYCCCRLYCLYCLNIWGKFDNAVAVG